MFEGGENLTFIAEAAKNKSRVHPALDHFDRYLLLELIVCTNGCINYAHSTCADHRCQAVRTELGADQIAFSSTCEHLHGALNRRLDEGGEYFVPEQRLDFTPQLLVARADFGEIAAAFGWVAFSQSLKDLFDLLPAFRIHIILCSSRDAARPAPSVDRE